jgi:DivIVA domain-containing protein
MKITPLEIRQHAFDKIFRGYNIDEVDTFLANISQEWERVLNEGKMLRMQLEIAEKEAGKLREIEMTLFKTLKTAEDTSTMITEQANQQGEKYVQEAHLKSESIVSEAKANAAAIIKEAEDRAKYIKEEVLGEVKGLERDFRAMDNYKDNLLVQMKSLANATIDHVERFESKFDKEGIQAKFHEATTMIEENIPIALPEPVGLTEEIPAIAETPTEIVEETPNEEVIAENLVEKIEEVPTEIVAETPVVEAISEEVTTIVEETPIAEITHEEVEMPAIEAIVEEIHTPDVVEPIAEIADPIVAVVAPIAETIEEPIAEIHVEETPIQSDNLKMIEGVGPKIEELLNNAGINTFKDLATTPAYKVKEILAEGGSRFASHDPTTWGEQAKLAHEQNWDELNALQDRLMGGRPEDVPVVAEVTPEPSPAPVVAPKIIQKDQQITEEMLEKVNKVKAAIRKSMLEKADNASKDNTPLTTVKDVMGKNEGGSFFDNL